MCSRVVCQFLQLSVYLKLTFINVNDPKPSPTTQEIIFFQFENSNSIQI